MRKPFAAFAGTVRRIVGFIGFALFWIGVWLCFDMQGLLLSGLGFLFGLFMAARIVIDVLNNHKPNAANQPCSEAK